MTPLFNSSMPEHDDAYPRISPNGVHYPMWLARQLAAAPDVATVHRLMDEQPPTGAGLVPIAAWTSQLDASLLQRLVTACPTAVMLRTLAERFLAQGPLVSVFLDAIETACAPRLADPNQPWIDLTGIVLPLLRDGRLTRDSQEAARIRTWTVTWAQHLSGAAPVREALAVPLDEALAALDPEDETGGRLARAHDAGPVVWEALLSQRVSFALLEALTANPALPRAAAHPGVRRLLIAATQDAPHYLAPIAIERMHDPEFPRLVAQLAGAPDPRAAIRTLRHTPSVHHRLTRDDLRPLYTAPLSAADREYLVMTVTPTLRSTRRARTS